MELSESLARAIGSASRSMPLEESLIQVEGAILWMDALHHLHILADVDNPLLSRFSGSIEPGWSDKQHLIGGLSSTNAQAVREALPNLKPRPLGLATSAGFGDRLGLATPGHVSALRRVTGKDGRCNVEPIFAQQSMREMRRTGRSPREVLDDATWGALRAGWTGNVGADADHLKTPGDIDECAEVGYSFYTIDPGEHVDDSASAATAAEVAQKLDLLPWAALETTAEQLLREYDGKRVEVEDLVLSFDRELAARSAVKYGAALAHVSRMYRHVKSKGIPFELEVSVDETETPTTPHEHAFIALELRRLHVHWVSLAPRFQGRFEKGVDFRGDIANLSKSFEAHSKIARSVGPPYKLSLHSGSDKFSVYDSIYNATRGLVHLKTAGTSYLEALRILSVAAPELFKAVLATAREQFPTDKASYHVSATLAHVPAPSEVNKSDLARLLEDDDVRQVLHVTFGSALEAHGTGIRQVLEENAEAYDRGLAHHFEKHLRPFARGHS